MLKRFLFGLSLAISPVAALSLAKLGYMDAAVTLVTMIGFVVWVYLCACIAERGFPDESPTAKDAARYRWLVKTNPDAITHTAYRWKAACKFSTPNEAIDAAMRTDER